MADWEFPAVLERSVIIAMKGLPCTGKSQIAHLIGLWAGSPVYYSDQFLDTVSLGKGYTADEPPPEEEAERLHRLAFDGLCKAASDYLLWGYKCVVIKSHLSSTFEVDRLVHLARERGCGMILIIDFQIKNEYRFRCRLEHKVTSGGQNEWYKPRNWMDIENAREDDEAANNWEEHLLRLLYNGDETDGLPQVTRLVLDPFDDLCLDPHALITTDSQKIIVYILRMLAAGVNLFLEGRYVVEQFKTLARYLREKEIGDFREIRAKYLCYADSGKYACLFKYYGEDDDDGNSYYCGVCEEVVVSGQPAYACHSCILTLHKSCAEQPKADIEGFEDIEFLRDYPNRLSPRHACKSCMERGMDFSHECSSCLFQTHLKCRVLPTILNRDCHDHFLFLAFCISHKCKACGTFRENGGASYGCYICSINYDTECLSLLRQVEHEHGGYKHLLKLLYSHDGMEEEAYWCGICYKDMDPQNWFYSCQDCPYYVAHPECVRLSGCTTSNSCKSS